MNSQHTTIAVFAKELLIIRPKDIMPHRIKILKRLINLNNLYTISICIFSLI